MGENWKLNHIGVAVNDVDKAIEYYKSLGAKIYDVEHYRSMGIDTSKPEIILDNKSFKDIETYGKPADPKLKYKIKFAQMDSVTFELLQPVEGESILKDFLNNNGEGIQHIAFTVDNLDEEITKFKKNGIPVIFSGKARTTGTEFAYFETRKIGNIIIELIKP